MRGKTVRIVTCLLLVLLIKAGLSPLHPSNGGSGRHASDCPALALKHLSMSNRRDKAVLRMKMARKYDQLQGLRQYETVVRGEAARIGVDWRLLSAIIWHESQFNEAAVSCMEAKGLMQLRDVTARHFGYGPDEVDLFDPQTNVAIGAKLIQELIGKFRQEGMDSTNAVRFALASYNCGGGTLAKRRTEAAEAGFNPSDWASVATVFARYSKLTPAYVDSVEQTYFDYCCLVE